MSKSQERVQYRQTFPHFRVDDDVAAVGVVAAVATLVAAADYESDRAIFQKTCFTVLAVRVTVMGTVTVNMVLFTVENTTKQLPVIEPATRTIGRTSAGARCQ